MFYMIFNSFIGSGMTENLYLDTKIFTLSAFLSELESLYYGPEHFLPLFGQPCPLWGSISREPEFSRLSRRHQRGGNVLEIIS